MKKVYFTQADGLKTEIFAQDGALWLTVYARADKAEIDLAFTYGADSERAATELKKLAGCLAKNNRGGLAALLKYAAEPEMPQKRSTLVEAGIYGGGCGNFESQLEVKDGRILYNVEMLAVGCMGTASFDLGPAQRGRLTKLCKIVERFEKELIGFVWVVKHRCIDTM